MANKKVKADQFNLSFSKSDQEQELYKWLDPMMGRGAFIKRALYKVYLEEVKGIVHTKVEVSEVKKEVEEAVMIDDGDFPMQ